MKKLFSLVLMLLSTIYSFAATNERSDSIDIRKITVNCNITDFMGKNLSAHANIDIRAKLNNIGTLVFDLEGLTVDSVLYNGNQVSFNHSGMTLWFNPGNPMNTNDTAAIDVFYHGIPVQDASWGGFYFVGNYAFQMGVGFNAQPHTFGRTWHPCFDNFVERASYEFYITTKGDKMGVSNGLFLDSTLQGNGDIIWHYKLEEEIPSYLAAVAVSDYVWVKKVLNGLNGITPFWVAAPAVDTNKVNGSFANLPSSFAMLEEHFGAHSFPKVGYTLVPFSAGAMEHATNIHIGTAFVNGNLSYETLIAHELSHHWWGDLVTCRTAGDMWLNEGWASYAERLHDEYVYGKDTYTIGVRENHFAVLSTAHISDMGYRAISPMDSNHTYGATVYNKGADVIHTLRTYLGDSAFFNGCKAFLNSNKFKDISSFDLRDFLSTYSGFNLTSFFDDWIFQSGFPHFSIDSTTISAVPNGYDVNVFLRHRKHQAAHYYTGVPLEVAFYDANFQPHIYKLTFNGRCMELKVNMPFEPLLIVIDPMDKISDAVTDDTEVIKNWGLKTLNKAKCRLYIKALNDVNDSSLIRVEHHWVRPDRFKTTNTNGYVLNDVRYWQVAGINLNNMQGLIQFSYNGTASDNFIDSSWIKNSEDSIRIFYRKDASQDWTFANDSITPFNLTDKFGTAYVKEFKAGEYCFGIKRSNYLDPLQSDYASGPCGLVTKNTSVSKLSSKIAIYPNPAKHYLQIRSEHPLNGLLELYSIGGKKVYEIELSDKQSSSTVYLPQLAPGMYIIRLQTLSAHYEEKISITE